MSAALLLYAFAMTTATATLLLLALRYRADLAQVTQERDDADARYEEAQATADFLREQHMRAAELSALPRPLAARLRPWENN